MRYINTITMVSQNGTLFCYIVTTRVTCKLQILRTMAVMNLHVLLSIDGAFPFSEATFK